MPLDISSIIAKYTDHYYIGFIEFGRNSCCGSYDGLSSINSKDKWFDNVSWDYRSFTQEEFYNMAKEKLRVDGVGVLSTEDCDYKEWNQIYEHFIDMYKNNDYNKIEIDVIEFDFSRN